VAFVWQTQWAQAPTKFEVVVDLKNKALDHAGRRGIRPLSALLRFDYDF
jgi:hypothetical protein